MIEFQKANSILQEGKPFDVDILCIIIMMTEIDAKLEAQLLYLMGNSANETGDITQGIAYYKEALQVIKFEPEVRIYDM